MPKFSHSDLLAMLDYDPATGVFLRKAYGVRQKKSLIGSRADYVESHGYRSVNLYGERHLASKLAWFYVHGEWPARPLRFKDGDENNCAISNLEFGKFHYATRAGRNAYDRADRVKNRDKYRGYEMKKRFGFDMAEYQRRFVAQGGMCAICAKPETETYKGQLKWLCVDHDHETGGIRDLLCSACNKAIGYMGDEPERLEKAAAYLRRHAAAVPANVVRLSRKRNPA